MEQQILVFIIQFTSCTFLLFATLLWMRRNGNRSRVYFSLVYAVCGVDLLLRIFGTYSGASLACEVLQPIALYMALIEIPLFLFYLIEVVNPGWLNWKKMGLLCLPWLAWNAIQLIPGLHFRQLDAFSDIFRHIGEVNVWLRLLFAMLILPYNILLYCIPYNWRRSSADRRLVRIYGGGFIVVALLFVGSSASGLIWASSLHLAYGTLFCFTLAYSELFVRLQVPKEEIAIRETGEECRRADQGQEITEKPAEEQWSQIIREIENEQMWRNPDMTIVALADLLRTNRTTLSRLFQEQGYSGGYKEFINRCRIADFLELMNNCSQKNMQDAFFDAGYRSRMTAFRNFKEYMGCTPSEYLNRPSDTMKR